MENRFASGMQFTAGMMLQQYEIIRPIGKGGMGEVYLARDTRLGRLVAIKFLLEHSGPAAGRFLAEARTTAQCRHDNIVVIYDLGEFDGFPYMVLEYIQGHSLRDTMSDGAKGLQAIAVDIILSVVRALERAHEMGIVHRDLKPENILISDTGQIKVLDFGIAKQLTPGYAATIAPGPPASIREFGTVHDGETISITPPAMEEAHSAVAETLPAIPSSSTANRPVAERSALVGTMPYMSPEQWRGEGIDGRTDIWAAGIILFELATGVHPLDPISAERIAQVKNLDIPMRSARQVRTDIGPLGDIIDRCLKKNKEERYGSAKELALALERIASDKRALPVHSADENPFAGLSAFQKSDAGRFFGRDHDIAGALRKLRSQQLVVIAGPSGAGKSSFVRAGIIPALERDGRNVESFMVRPGRRPFAALADVLASCHDTNDWISDADPEALAATLRTQPGLLGATLRARCRKRGADHRIIFLVDQLEELFTQGTDPADRMAFCACIEGVADDASSPLRVIATIRADFLDRIAEDRRFWGEVTRGLVFLPPMTRDGLRDALMKPLEAVQYRFEDDRLVEEMLDGLEGTTTPLPILQFTATKLWDARDRERQLLTRSAYEALGGVAGALSTHADAVVAGLSLPEQQLARTILMALVTPERSRALVRLDELVALAPDHAAVEQVLQRLADARLISMDTSGERKGKTVELTHESLIARWAKLRQWLDNDEQDAQFLVQLRNAAQQWEKNGEPEGFLWRDRAAVEAGEWLERRKAERREQGSIGLAKREERYLEAVVRLAERARTWRRRIAGTVILSLVVIAVVVSVLAYRAQEHAMRADAQKAEAEAQRAEAEAQKADAQAQRAEAERSATRARNATRVAAARERHADPTTALALLREIEPGPLPQGWSELAKWARSAGAAKVVLHHDEIVSAARFSPDGQYIVSACVDNRVRIWNADGSGQARVFRGHTDGVQWADWSPDGKRIVSASRDKTVRVWNVDESGQPLILQGHSDAVWSAEFSPDGQRIVSASWDKTVRVWNSDGSGQPRILNGHTEHVVSATFSPDGKRIASASDDKTVRIWNEDGSTPTLVLRGQDAPVRGVAFSPDGTRIVFTSQDKIVRIWNADGSGAPILLQGHEGWTLAAGWSPDGKRIVSAGADHTMRIWNADGSATPLMVRRHAAEIESAMYSPDGRYILTGSRDRTVRVWNAIDEVGFVSVPGHSGLVYSVAFSRDGRNLATASEDKTVRIWNANGKGEPVVLRGHENTVMSVGYSPDGQYIVSASADKTVRIWNADGSGKPTILRGHNGAVYSVAYRPDGQRILTASDDKTAREWNAGGSNELLHVYEHPAPLTAAQYSPDGSHIVTASVDKSVRVWNVGSSDNPLILRGYDDGVYAAVYSPDGKRIATASVDKTVRIWNADGSGSPLILRGHSHSVWQVAWSPDGQRIATASQDTTVRVWNADGTGEVMVLRGASNGYNSVVWSLDGKRIVAVSDDKTMTIWSDIDPIRQADDSRLWTPTSYCMPLEVRRQLLDFPDSQFRADSSRCQERVHAIHQ